MRTIQDAQQADRPLVFVKDHASLSDAARQAFLDQELNHVRQGLLGPPAGHLADSATPFVSSPAGTKARAALEKAGYRFEGPNKDNIAAFEIGERLMRPGAYRELKLSSAERDALSDRYVQSLEKQYGEKAGNVAARVRASQNDVPRS